MEVPPDFSPQQVVFGISTTGVYPMYFAKAPFPLHLALVYYPLARSIAMD
jgi:hypothetical protein